ncbi:MAG: enoyl-CoA hydratase-related protein [Acidiferrobacterales bacterium]|nr:enoyl-CoA hydratase-related protein [Acidiferrobacterales bacterium]
MNAVFAETHEGVCHIRLNRPKQFNALNHDLLEGLAKVIDEIRDASDVRCAVLRGEGANFMAGGDIHYFHELRNLDRAAKTDAFNSLISRVHVLVENIAALPVPVIASVRGAAAGFGISLVAGCDLAIASENSFFTSAYNLLGTSPDGGSTYYLPRSVGMKKSMEVTLLTKRYSAREALEMGLINMVVEDSALDDTVASTAATIVNSASKAVANAKRLIRQSFDNDLSTQLNCELNSFLECMAEDDFFEGVAAFVEKRRPRFAP